MAVVRSTEDLSALANVADNSVSCTICNDSTSDTVFTETGCRHKFHRACLSEWLNNNTTCPNCRQPCSLAQSSENLASAATTNTRNTIGRPRGATGNNSTGTIPRTRPATRSNNRNNIQNMRPPASVATRRDSGRSASDNYIVNSDDRIQQIIASSLESYRASIAATVSDQISTALRNLSLSALRRESRDGSQLEWDNEIHLNVPRANVEHDSNQRRRPSGARANTIDYSTDRPDRISNVISNWKVKFSGSASDLPIEDFIYRVNCLTSQYFNSNFDLLYQFANLLFSGSALTFYWRVHRTTGHMNWFELCNKLRERYQDQRTDRDIKQVMRHRKQGSNESFDEFLDAMVAIADSLRDPMSEADIITEVRHNLKSELRHELLHVDIPSLAILRKECHRHEEFFRNSRTKLRENVSKRIVNAIRHEEESEEESESESEVIDEVCAVRLNDKLKCWNCDEQGHRYHDCLKPRRIFCYGCGLPDIYKPNCVKCKPTAENSAQDVLRVQRGDVRR